MVSCSDSHCPCTAPAQCIERDYGRYLVAIYRLGDDRRGRITTGEVSEYFDVSPSSATEMFEKLATAGVVDYERYHGVTLTEDGERIARELDRRQRIVHTFFASTLSTSLDADAEYQFGYLLPESGIERLCELADVESVEQSV